jgi:hypothetical protein
MTRKLLFLMPNFYIAAWPADYLPYKNQPRSIMSIDAKPKKFAIIIG